MNIIKKTLLGILVLFLTGLIILLTLSADLKNVIVNGVVMEIVKYQITNISYKAGNKEQTTIFEYTTDDEKVNEILESKEIQELISKYVDITIKSMTDEESIDQIDIEQDMINYIKENKKVIEEKTGVQISDEMIEQTKEEIEAQEINENVKIALKETKKNLTDSQKKTLKGYGLVTSTKLKVFLLVLIIIDSIFIKIEPIMAKTSPKNIVPFNLFFFLSIICNITVTKRALEFDNNFVIKEEFFSLLIKKLEVKTEHTTPYKPR